MTTTTYSFLPNTPFTNSYSYDASGNVLNDGINAYAWNAESETKTASGVTYTYDGLGNRVEKSNGTLYWYGPGGEVLDETNLTGSLTSEYVFFAGKRVARRDASGNLYYYAEDFIGSSRVITQANGTLCSDADFLPFGQEVDYTSGCAQNYKFEGKERDIETGNDNFGARYYRSALGRWMSPDWSAIPAPVPYANLTNPQTLNLYAMTSDNPETFADLDGHLGGILEPIATNPNGLGPDMEVDSGWYEDQYGNIILGAPPDPTPQQPVTPSQSPTDAQPQQGNQTAGNGAAAPGTCRAELEYRPVDDWRAKLVGATHSFWLVQDDTETWWTISAGPETVNKVEYLDVWVTKGTGNGPYSAGNDKAKVQFDSGSSAANCAGVNKILATGRAYEAKEQNTIKYGAKKGPNSNSISRYLGAVGGFNPKSPPHSFGWPKAIPDLE